MTAHEPTARFDHMGRVLTIAGCNDGILLAVADDISPHPFALESDGAVQVARDLLERSDCTDPDVRAARAALRRWADMTLATEAS